MPRSVTLIALIAILIGTSAALAQDDPGPRMTLGHIGDARPGAYSAGDQLRFTLNRYGERYVLQFDGEEEIYVLYAEHGSLGGRVLRYDSGGTAMIVSGWSGLTLYTDAQPAGLPAERTGDANVPTVTQISLANMQAAADDEAEHLAYTRRIRLSFGADWPALLGNSELRALTFDALQNAARGIDRFAATAEARAALAAKVEWVRILAGERPVMALHGKTLNVIFNPANGFAGRASSRGIARGLGLLFSVPTSN